MSDEIKRRPESSDLVNAERYDADRHAVPLVDEEGEPLSLAEALKMRDELLAQRREFGHRRSDVTATSYEAAKRLGRLEAHLALIGRR